MTDGPMVSVVLARGLGRRMQALETVELDSVQHAAACAGHKAMMPVGGTLRRPFLDYALSVLADAGCTDVILVVAPEHTEMREWYHSSRLSRVRVRFAVQPEASGTAHAVLAAAPMITDRPFLVLNADNLYPVEVLRSLAALDTPGLPAFERSRLVRESGFPDERVASFALLDVDDEGWLRGITEKPGAERLAAGGERALVSMNVWRFDQRILAACADVPPSPRGEHELPEAVGLALGRGVPFRVVPARGAVLDLSRRTDVSRVSERLREVEPRL